jgi:hypothetical protein
LLTIPFLPFTTFPHENGYKVSLNTVTRYRQELGLKAVLAVKQVNDALEKHLDGYKTQYNHLHQ